MGYTWKQFNDAVKVFLTVDKRRIGIGEAGGFNDMMIRQAVLEIQSVIPFYRSGQENTYLPADMTPVGATSMLELPEAAELKSAKIVRAKDPASNLTGTTDANGVTSIVGTGTLFLTELAVGDRIKLSGGTGYVQVASIASDTALTVDTATGNGSTQTIMKRVEYSYPALQRGWENREEYFAGQVCVNDLNAYCLISPYGTLYVYPALQVLDSDSETHSLVLTWDGVKLDFEDGDAVPFDEPMVLCVADYVKMQIARHVQHDLQESAAFGGTYLSQRKKLYLDAKAKTRIANG